MAHSKVVPGAPTDGAHSVTVDSPEVNDEDRLTHAYFRELMAVLLEAGATLEDLKSLFLHRDDSWVRAKVQAYFDEANEKQLPN